MTVFLAFLLASAEIEIPKTWVYQEDRDAITDLVGAKALLISKDHDAGLILRCEVASKDRPLTLVLSLADNKSLYSNSDKVILRFDEAKAVEQTWAFKYGVAYVPESKQLRDLLSSIQSASILRVRVPDASGELNDSTFEVAGSSKTFAQVLAACGKPDYLSMKGRRSSR